jgi:gliding motility-associated-like protein
VFRPVAQFVYDGEEFKPESYELLILNRWGEIIFQSNDLSIGWDGTYMDKPVQQGTYIYQLKAQGTDNRFIFQKGSVTLLR